MLGFYYNMSNTKHRVVANNAIWLESDPKSSGAVSTSQAANPYTSL